MQGHKLEGGVKLSPRTGRPPLQETSRTEKLNIRLTKKEKEDIQYCSDILRISRTDTIMEGIGLIKNKITKK